MRIRVSLLVAILAMTLIPLPAQAASVTAPALLELLSVQEETNSSSYVRTKFKHWIDQDKDGCDTRSEVLLQESISPTKRGSKCKVLSGKWLSHYEKKTFTKPTGLDIDHMVPLKEAWESGAANWTSAQRQAFANDLGFAGSLIAVSASTNRSKGDKDPAGWMPSNKAYRCTYVVTWMLVKYRWSLSIDAKEASSISTTLESCPASKLYALPKQAIKPSDSTPSPTPSPSETATAAPDNQLDPRFDTCKAAKEAGYGPYVKGVDPEYDWYRDGDSDGTVCE